MKNTLRIILLSLLILLLASCSGEVKAPDDSWENVFLQFWNVMNTEYVHFSQEDSLDWDKVYDDYLGKFKALDFSKKEDSIKAFRYFKEIVYNTHDYHYCLTVTDAFNQSLRATPSMLKKYVAAGNDAMDYPDIKLLDRNNILYATSINNSEKNYSRDERAQESKKAIPSISEVSELMGDDATGIGNSWGNFHSTDGDIDTEFPDNAYYGYTFSPFTDEDIEKLHMDQEDIEIAAKWNAVIEAIGLESYFYGVNKDGVFYIYFSAFGHPYFLTDFFTKATPTEEEQALLNEEKTLRDIRNYVQDLIKEADDTENGSFKKIIKQGVEGIYGLQKMINTLYSVTTNNKAFNKTVDGVVMDLRCNGGGYNAFLYNIWGAFFPSETQFGYVRYKSGYARNEYTPWVSYSIDKDYLNTNLKEAYSNPVAVIVNGDSVSCSEFSCVIAKLLPSSVIVGEQTYGGISTLDDRKVYNGGTFNSDHLEVYTTTYQFIDNDRVSYETIGIKPDIETELSTFKDDTFIEAMKWVTTHSK